MKSILAFIRGYWPILVLCAILTALFALTDNFSDFLYGALRFVAIHVVAFAVRATVFRKTLRPYVAGYVAEDGSEQGFVPDFFALTPAVKVSLSLGLFAVYLLVGALCFVS